MSERVRVWQIDNDEGNRLLRMVRRSSGSVVTWWRARRYRRDHGLDVGTAATA